jgi:hypothetical protein
MLGRTYNPWNAYNTDREEEKGYPAQRVERLLTMCESLVIRR